MKIRGDFRKNLYQHLVPSTLHELVQYSCEGQSGELQGQNFLVYQVQMVQWCLKEQ